MPDIFSKIQQRGFNTYFTYHADAIFYQDFPDASGELDEIISEIEIPIVELVGGGGGEAKVTQRLRRALHDAGWHKRNFQVEKRINDRTTQSQSHEVDHIKDFPKGTVALEIEWNNKDPFFDRDLENFNRLHADGGISIGLIVTRGVTLQEGIEERIRAWAEGSKITSFDDLKRFRIDPTHRQRNTVTKAAARLGNGFAQVWAHAFVADKFGQATTHWSKLQARLDRGVGSPCPIVGIGIPLSRVTD